MGSADIIAIFGPVWPLAIGDRAAPACYSTSVDAHGRASIELAVRREERAQLSGLTEHVLDLSPYTARTYFWRWNNRKGNFGRNFLSDADLKLALE